MPNQPAEDTISTSFTLPRALYKELKRRARAGMTNKSDIIRQALLNYLPEDSRAAVLRELAAADGSGSQVGERVKSYGDAAPGPNSASPSEAAEISKRGEAAVSATNFLARSASSTNSRTRR